MSEMDRIIAVCTSSGAHHPDDPFYPVPKAGTTHTMDELLAVVDQQKRADAARGHAGTPLTEEDLDRCERVREEAYRELVRQHLEDSMPGTTPPDATSGPQSPDETPAPAIDRDPESPLSRSKE